MVLYEQAFHYHIPKLGPFRPTRTRRIGCGRHLESARYECHFNESQHITFPWVSTFFRFDRLFRDFRNCDWIAQLLQVQIIKIGMVNFPS